MDFFYLTGVRSLYRDPELPTISTATDFSSSEKLVDSNYKYQPRHTFIGVVWIPRSFKLTLEGGAKSRNVFACLGKTGAITLRAGGLRLAVIARSTPRMKRRAREVSMATNAGYARMKDADKQCPCGYFVKVTEAKSNKTKFEEATQSRFASLSLAATMKPESKKNRSESTKSSEGNTASPSCYDLTALSQALDDEAPVNNNNDKSSFDLSNISEALNNVAMKEKKRLLVLRSIAQSQEEAKTRQIRARRLRYICETLRTRKMAGERVHGEIKCFPTPAFSLADTDRWLHPGSSILGMDQMVAMSSLSRCLAVWHNSGGVLDLYDPNNLQLKNPTTTTMPLFTNIELLEPSLSLLDYTMVYREPHLSYPLFDAISSTFELFDNVLDLAHFERRTPFSSCYRTIRSTSGSTSLYDRVTVLDLEAFHPVFNDASDRKYTWTDEIKCPQKKWLGQKYKVTAEIKGSEIDRKYKYTAEIESPEKIGFDGKYKWSAEIKGEKHDKGQKHKEVSIKIKEPESGAVVCTKDKKKATRLVEIEEPLDQGAIYLRQAFAKRAEAVARARGKTKILSPEAAALMIQVGFRTYLIRRSQALQSLRELAITKAKLNEIRTLFNNFTYRRCIARDVEERKRFAERIIALLLSGADLMVRAVRRSMLDELEAMLDLVGPHPPGKLGFLKSKKFEWAENSFLREIAAGVADVIQMLDQDEKSDNATFQVCL
ncbi:unnamed protein product [Dovyalis caffra]|uniref:Uncharacterized protein n=1 Tax=Dovyalis caffra TaxID=77055 RepID=A0AAV1S9C9_9ROSI|nr:unnamed protein product [Dovyalis caffra]